MERQVADAVLGFNTKSRLPDDRYAIRIIEETFSPSKSSGNPMITTQFEIVSPEVVDINGAQTNVAGVQLKHYTTVKVKKEDGSWDAEKSDAAFGRLVGYYKAIGVDAGASFDDENPPLLGKGKLVDALITTEEGVARKTPTPEQKAAGKLGDEILDGNGQKIVNYYPKIKALLGPSSEVSNKAF